MLKIPTTIKNEKLVARRREQLINSGIKLFGKKGFHGTTLKDLAEEAAISYGNIYDYVGSKEDIFYLIHDFLYRKSLDLFNRSMADLKDPLERLRGSINCELKIMEKWSEATLLMYQETHILSEIYLKELLKRERLRLGKMEEIIAECVEQGLLKPCNPRLTANLIKSMMDAWVLKRWDLRGHASIKEAEQTILDMVFNGLVSKPEQVSIESSTSESGNGCALVVNGGTVLGSACCSFLAKKGLKVSTYIDQFSRSREYPILEPKSLQSYFADKDGPLGSELVERIERENGPLDVYIHDFGMGNTASAYEDDSENDVVAGLDENIFKAYQALAHIRKAMARRGAGRIVFMAPWSWDRYLDAVQYETAKAAIAAMTRAFSQKLSPSGVNVNCIVPGFIKSVRPSPLEKKFSRQVVEEIPQGRLGEIQDLLDAVWFFICNDSRYVTGQVLNISGGN